MLRSILPATLICFLCLSSLSAGTRPVPAPDFTLPASGGNVSLHDLRGKVVLVDFWASWCVPCRESFPWLNAQAERYGKDGLLIVSINLDKEWSTASRFLDRHHATFRVAFDPAGKTATAFRVKAMPSSFIVDRSGNIVYAHEGFELAKARVLEDHIKEALSQ